MITTGPRRLARARSSMRELPSRAELSRMNDRELTALKAEVRRGLAACDDQRRRLYNALGDIQAVAQRRNRPCR
jgi:hypothetical protein